MLVPTNTQPRAHDVLAIDDIAMLLDWIAPHCKEAPRHSILHARQSDLWNSWCVLWLEQQNTAA